ncbi:hypothetical protein R3P38DRAFT_2915555 [Favolaschia claudopus]|uniref:Secreted protein n=1 Tax=Favolaschia claudopus TaxID=2862362 RepID=A0AAW0C4T5_9AGAR
MSLDLGFMLFIALLRSSGPKGPLPNCSQRLARLRGHWNFNATPRRTEQATVSVIPSKADTSLHLYCGREALKSQENDRFMNVIEL